MKLVAVLIVAVTMGCAGGASTAPPLPPSAPAVAQRTPVKKPARVVEAAKCIIDTSALSYDEQLCKRECKLGRAGGCAAFEHAKKSIGVVQAVLLYEKSCAAGNGPSCFNLGTILVGANPFAISARSVVLFRRACDHKLVDGCLAHANSYRRRAMRDLAQVAIWEHRAIDLMVAEICPESGPGLCWKLGQRFEHGYYMLPNAVHAARLYRAGCEAEHGRSCEKFADKTHKGIGTGKSAKTASLAIRRAILWHARACRRNDKQSCRRLAGIYHRGQYGVTAQPTTARRLAIKAELLYAKGCRNDGWRCLHVGDDWKTGRAPLPRNLSRAAAMFRKGCDKNVWIACYELGIMVEKGLGGERVNIGAAKRLYTKACDEHSTSPTPPYHPIRYEACVAQERLERLERTP